MEWKAIATLKFSLLSILFEDDGFRGEEGRGQLQPEKPIQ